MTHAGMTDELIRVVAPHFVAGYDTATGNIAPIIKRMRGWTLDRISQYCNGKGWKCYIVRSKTQ